MWYACHWDAGRSAIPELVAKQGAEFLTLGTSAEDIADRMSAFLRGELKADRAKLRSVAEKYSADRGLKELSQDPLLLQTADVA